MKEIVSRYNLEIVRIHTHIGSGSDPDIWQNVAGLSLNLVADFPNVVTLNLGYLYLTLLGVIGAYEYAVL